MKSRLRAQHRPWRQGRAPKTLGHSRITIDHFLGRRVRGVRSLAVRFSNRPLRSSAFQTIHYHRSMSLAGSRFSSESSPRPFQHGIRRRGGTIRRAAFDPAARQAVPASLHASLIARLDRLGPAKEVAQIGAAIGREFSHALLAAWCASRRWIWNRRWTV